ncbi:hypothetical protein GCM10010492_72450 [Saccharothrix mutabilis subsp. mutabilis]|uniref:Adenylate/guanylate cyclase domain-containing protein n=1 Tax=Saccharothrix mutabilis subsp. mutabilis TaxID=66855 RepID=A0ABP3EHW8_9PSEU
MQACAVRNDEPATLARLGHWTEDVYRDLLAVEGGQLTRDGFRARHCHRVAVLVLDIAGFTERGMAVGEVDAFLRVLHAQRICLPVLERRGAALVRAFADDLVALFGDPLQALEAALELHAAAEPADIGLCIGLGYGDVFAIGPNRAMGTEMNQASKLGEDTARRGETLLTESAYRAVEHRTDRDFIRHDDVLPFPFHAVA